MGSFYWKMAFQNVKRSRIVYLPYAIATAVISGVYFLILALINSETISAVPSGNTAQMMMSLGIIVFTFFAFGFMLYVNNFLISRRKKEFGLYAVLGMNKAQVSCILRNEGLIVIGGGVIAGMALGTVFGRLLFLLLMQLIHAAPDSTFSIPLVAFLGTLALFAAVYIVTAIRNSIVVARTGTSELLSSDKSGEKDPKGVVATAIIGAVLLAAAYVTAIITIGTTMLAMSLFFPAVVLVIIATYMLFKSGSIAILRGLKKNKQLYYKPDNFIAISGMFHRMRQNSRGLATICILFTMLLVTVAGTASLYLGQEEILRIQNPSDVEVFINNSIYEDENGVEIDNSDEIKAAMQQLDAILDAKEQNSGLKFVSAADKVVIRDERNSLNDWLGGEGITAYEGDVIKEYKHFVTLRDNGICYFDIQGDDSAAKEFATVELYQILNDLLPTAGYGISEIYSARIDAYGTFGGLVFIGAFFAVLFLVGTVLIIYFKQVTEGYEDKQRFEIMQKVGMDDDEVKRTVRKQIKWVFFLPLASAIIHIAFASGMIATMLQAFSLFNTTLTFTCVAVTSVVFAVVYMVVYLQTAKTYYKIVKK